MTAPPTSRPTPKEPRTRASEVRTRTSVRCTRRRQESEGRCPNAYVGEGHNETLDADGVYFKVSSPTSRRSSPSRAARRGREARGTCLHPRRSAAPWSLRQQRCRRRLVHRAQWSERRRQRGRWRRCLPYRLEHLRRRKRGVHRGLGRWQRIQWRRWHVLLRHGSRAQRELRRRERRGKR